jgi:hypothetical protein
MSKSLKEIAGIFSFVVREVDRISSLLKNEPGLFQDIVKKGGMIQKQKGGGYMCGPEAALQVLELAKERVELYPELKGRCKLNSFLHPLEDQIARRFIENREKISEAAVKELFRSARNAAMEKLIDWKYLFPTYAVHWEGGDFIKLGKVEFIKSHTFFQSNREVINKSIENGEIFLKDGENFYTRFPWVAIVEIKRMEPEIGHRQASNVLEQTLNCLRLVIRSNSDHFTGIVEECPLSESSSSLAIDENGKFLSGKSWKLIQPIVNEEFFKSIEGDRWLNLILHMIEKYQDCLELTPLEERLMEGLSWFGQGWKEKDLSSKLIKYVTCLEGLLLLSNEREGITEKLAERIALLSKECFEKRKELFNDAKQIYDARSKLVHGKSVFSEEELLSLCSKAESIAQLMLYTCGEIFLIFGNVRDEDKILKEFFDLSKLSKDKDEINKFLLKFRPIQKSSEAEAGAELEIGQIVLGSGVRSARCIFPSFH